MILPPSRRDVLAGLGALAAAPLLGWATPARAESPLTDALDKLVKKGFTADGPGLAVLVRPPRGPRFHYCFGLADLKDHTPITPRTLFELASVSKTFTATAVLILHDRGKLSVLDDVRKYIPELPESSKRWPLRITDLLQHVSGLPDYLEFEDVPARHKDYWDNEDYLGEFARRRDKFRDRPPPGEKFEYNNTNYLLLAVVVARVAKQSFGTFLRDEIFGPVGMKDSFVYESPDAVPMRPAAGAARAVGYEKEKGEWKAAWGAPPARAERLLTVGDGGVWTNLEDMEAWDTALRRVRLVKPLTMRLALTPSETRDGKVNDHYGRGWALYFGGAGAEGAVLNRYGHYGAWGGFNTAYQRDLVADRTTVILSNRGDFDPKRFWYTLNGLVEKNLP
jgi:CubicO group peptidase (beta-lactamase class C family)